MKQKKWCKNFCLLFVIVVIAYTGITGCNKRDGKLPDTEVALDDKTPDPFVLNAQTEAAFNTVVTSDSLTVSGINAATNISIAGADGTYSINDGEFTSSAGTVNNGDTVRVRFTSSSTFGATASVTLDIGGVAGIFSVTTIHRVWSAASAGAYNTFAIDADGSLFAWGRNTYGHLGDGTTIDKNVPTRIGTDSDWLTVDAGGMAIKKDGSLFAWGSNSYGQLGDGTTVFKSIPTRIGTDSDWASVSTGGYHTVAIKKDGSLFAWGRNDKGQLGDGTNTDKHVPTRIGTDTDWLSVSCDAFHTLAIKKDCSLYGWGLNDFYQLGLGPKIDYYAPNWNKNIPTRIGTDTDWLSVAAGTFNVAVKKDGSLFSWGDLFRPDYPLPRLLDQYQHA